MTDLEDGLDLLECVARTPAARPLKHIAHDLGRPIEDMARLAGVLTMRDYFAFEETPDCLALTTKLFDMNSRI